MIIWFLVVACMNGRFAPSLLGVVLVREFVHVPSDHGLTRTTLKGVSHQVPGVPAPNLKLDFLSLALQLVRLAISSGE